MNRQSEWVKRAYFHPVTLKAAGTTVNCINLHLLGAVSSSVRDFVELSDRECGSCVADDLKMFESDCLIKQGRSGTFHLMYFPL